MNMKFKCPECGADVEAEPQFAGKAADCPACQQLIIIPHIVSSTRSKQVRPLVPDSSISTSSQAHSSDGKSFEDHAADAIYNTGKFAAKAAWKATKVGVPMAFKIGGKLYNKIENRVAETPVGKAIKDAPPPKKRDQAGMAILMIARWLGF